MFDSCMSILELATKISQCALSLISFASLVSVENWNKHLDYHGLENGDDLFNNDHPTNGSIVGNYGRYSELNFGVTIMIIYWIICLVWVVFMFLDCLLFFIGVLKMKVFRGIDLFITSFFTGLCLISAVVFAGTCLGQQIVTCGPREECNAQVSQVCTLMSPCEWYTVRSCAGDIFPQTTSVVKNGNFETAAAAAFLCFFVGLVNCGIIAVELLEIGCCC